VIRRTYLGLDIRTRELRTVALHRKGRSSSLAGGRIISLAEGVVAPSFREPNILNFRSFTDSLHEVLGPLAGREERIALSLPESAGRILLTEVETAFKTKEEGSEVLRWQLKSSVPFEPSDIRLDYQVLEKSDTGRQRLVVELISGKVLEQYEEVITEAGYNPTMVDFHSLNLYNYYRPRLDLGENFILVGIEGGTLSFQFFQSRTLAFHRVREVEANPGKVFRELNLTLVGCREKYSGFRRAAVFMHSDWEENGPLLEALTSAFERDVVLLDPHLERLTPASLDLPPWRSRSLAAAVGAAERMMWR
jgi:type IV pilus assembly protein PilM